MNQPLTKLEPAAMALDLPIFQAPFPWVGGDLQTIRSTIMSAPVPALVMDRLLVDLTDGSGALNCAVGGPGDHDYSLLLVHGLGGHEDSVYMQRVARQFNTQGWRTYRMNYRGVGPSRKTSRVPYSAGLTDDIRATCRAITALEGKPPFVMGFSLGGQMVLRTLGEDGILANAYCAGALSVSAPVDLAESVRQIARPRNGFYHSYLVKKMRRDLRRGFGDRVDQVHTIREIDDRLIAPVFGFSGADDYYNSVACGQVLQNIKVPTLMLHADDDPWIPVMGYLNLEKSLEKTPVNMHISRGGGHVGFFDKLLRDEYMFQIALKFYILMS